MLGLSSYASFDVGWIQALTGSNHLNPSLLAMSIMEWVGKNKGCSLNCVLKRLKLVWKLCSCLELLLVIERGSGLSVGKEIKRRLRILQRWSTHRQASFCYQWRIGCWSLSKKSALREISMYVITGKVNISFDSCHAVLTEDFNLSFSGIVGISSITGTFVLTASFQFRNFLPRN